MIYDRVCVEMGVIKTWLSDIVTTTAEVIAIIKHTPQLSIEYHENNGHDTQNDQERNRVPERSCQKFYLRIQFVEGLKVELKLAERKSQNDDAQHW